jgi:hypothetical protein
MHLTTAVHACSHFCIGSVMCRIFLLATSIHPFFPFNCPFFHCFDRTGLFTSTPLSHWFICQPYGTTVRYFGTVLQCFHLKEAFFRENGACVKTNNEITKLELNKLYKFLRKLFFQI